MTTKKPNTLKMLLLPFKISVLAFPTSPLVLHNDNSFQGTVEGCKNQSRSGREGLKTSKSRT